MTSSKEKGIIVEGGRLRFWATVRILQLKSIPVSSAVDGIEKLEEDAENLLEDLVNEIERVFILVDPSSARTFISFGKEGILAESVQFWKPRSPSELNTISAWLKQKSLFKEPERF